MDKIRTYAQFWPFYLSEHSHKLNRQLHFLGTSIAFVLLICSLLMLNAWLVLAAFFVGYLFAWIGHFLIEKNKPATFKYPFWSLISDWRMWFLMLTRQPLMTKKTHDQSST